MHAGRARGFDQTRRCRHIPAFFILCSARACARVSGTLQLYTIPPFSPISPSLCLCFSLLRRFSCVSPHDTADLSQQEAPRIPPRLESTFPVSIVCLLSAEFLLNVVSLVVTTLSGRYLFPPVFRQNPASFVRIGW